MVAMSEDLLLEIKQSKPFKSQQEETFLQILRTADKLQYELGQLLKAHDLTLTQYNALRILRGAGKDGLPCHEIGGRMITKVPDITRLLDRLESRHLVSRARTEEDRRVVRARITSAGTAVVNALDTPLDSFHVQQLQHLSETEMRELNTLLRKARRPKGA